MFELVVSLIIWNNELPRLCMYIHNTIPPPMNTTCVCVCVYSVIIWPPALAIRKTTCNLELMRVPLFPDILSSSFLDPVCVVFSQTSGLRRRRFFRYLFYNTLVEIRARHRLHSGVRPIANQRVSRAYLNMVWYKLKHHIHRYKRSCALVLIDRVLRHILCIIFVYL